jgi:hypothetical protein
MVDTQISLDTDFEAAELEMRNNHRKQVLEAYTSNLDDIRKRTYDNKKNWKNRICVDRIWTLNVIKRIGNYSFTTEEEEYQMIGKYPRKMWIYVENEEEDLAKFNEEEKELLRQIAKEFGAFDY